MTFSITDQNGTSCKVWYSILIIVDNVKHSILIIILWIPIKGSFKTKKLVTMLNFSVNTAQLHMISKISTYNSERHDMLTDDVHA